MSDSERPPVPTLDECRLLLEKYRVPSHIRRHSELVARVAGNRYLTAKPLQPRLALHMAGWQESLSDVPVI